ncbi:MAG TPA: hypothetical protein VG077_15640 [Verrucomicrobiae bacterium]|nr:hypothetical protein [Verrucomicrobiae bacterium]
MNNTSLPPAKRGRRPAMSRWFIAVLLGIISLFLLFFLGETWGENTMFIGVGAYCLIAQYFLSRGHLQALRKDWSIILCLNFMVLVSTVLCLVLEPNPAARLTAVILALTALACSFAGAALAARTAPGRVLP